MRSPAVYRAQSGRMAGDGTVFYRSVNGVWLTKKVPATYLEKVSKEEGKRNDLTFLS